MSPYYYKFPVPGLELCPSIITSFLSLDQNYVPLLLQVFCPWIRTMSLYYYKFPVPGLELCPSIITSFLSLYQHYAPLLLQVSCPWIRIMSLDYYKSYYILQETIQVLCQLIIYICQTGNISGFSKKIHLLERFSFIFLLQFQFLNVAL